MRLSVVNVHSPTLFTVGEVVDGYQAPGIVMRIAEMDRSVVVPAGTSDAAPGSLGDWESSGVLDVTKLICTAPGERLLIADIQAHGIRDGVIAGDLLEQGGQLKWNFGRACPLRRRPSCHSDRMIYYA
jgi:hypothetical protein